LFFSGSFCAAIYTVSASPYTEGTIPHVDLFDIGCCAAEILVTPEPHANTTLNILSNYTTGGSLARSMSMKVVGTVYEPTAPHHVQRYWEAHGLEKWAAAANVEALSAYIGEVTEVTSDISKILGRPPTSFSAFCTRELKGHVKREAGAAMLSGFGLQQDNWENTRMNHHTTPRHPDGGADAGSSDAQLEAAFEEEQRMLMGLAAIADGE
jgi:hypothetical protein